MKKKGFVFPKVLFSKQRQYTNTMTKTKHKHCHIYKDMTSIDNDISIKNTTQIPIYLQCHYICMSTLQCNCKRSLKSKAGS